MPLFVKKSRSVWGLPVGIVATSSHSAFSPPALIVLESGAASEKPGGAWSSSCATAVPTSASALTTATQPPSLVLTLWRIPPGPGIYTRWRTRSV